MFEIRFKGTNDIIEDALARKINFNENQAAIFEFELLYNNDYFNDLKKFIDLIEVWKINQTGEDERIFDGRVLDVQKDMSSDGIFFNKIICESVLNYLNDVHVGVWEVHPGDLPKDAPAYAEANYTADKFFKKILDNYNSLAAENRKIYVGNVTVTDPIYCMTNRETSLAVIYDKLINRKGGFLNLREVNGKYYLDYLKENPEKSTNDIEIGLNMKDIHVEDNLKSMCTRLIGVGNEGKITSIAEDPELIKKYGVIEQVHEWKDVTIQENLDRKVKDKLKEINNNSNIVEINALDISYLNNDLDNLRIGQTVTAVCDPLEYEKDHRIISIDLDLEQPWNSTFKLDNPDVSQISVTESIIQETNDNKLEILQMNGKLIQKVSSSEFNSYREQTDKAIIERVTGSEFESYKEQTEQELSQTVKNGDFKTKFNQNIEGFDFIIGSITPLSIRKDKLQMQFDDGTTCSMGKDGFYYKDGGSNYAYKSMVQRGSVSKVKSGDTVRINLPANFRGKDYEISWWTGNVFPAHDGDLLFSANSELVRQNKREGWFEIRANMMVRNPNTSDRTPFMRGSLNVVWIAIA